MNPKKQVFICSLKWIEGWKEKRKILSEIEHLRLRMMIIKMMAERDAKD